MAFRNICFTLNNYTDEDEKKLENSCPKPFVYIIYGRETGASGTPHLQGYAELGARTRMKTLKKFLPKAHIEKRKGSQEQAITYCKKDGNVVEHGTRKRAGKRTDIDELHHAVKQKRKLVDIYNEYPAAYKYGRGIDRHRLLLDMQERDFTPMEVIVMVGEAGSGKTRKAYEIDPLLYMLPDYTSPLWFDGYDGEDTILFDDFKGCIKFTYLLRLLDGYRFSIPIKGGFIWKKWKRVIITSNHPPEEWYKNVHYAALKRRISEVQIISNTV